MRISAMFVWPKLDWACLTILITQSREVSDTLEVILPFSRHFWLSTSEIQSLQSTLPVANLTSAHVDRYIATKSAQISRQTLQHIVARLRAFLRYSFELQLIPERLDRIDTPRTYRGELPPRALPWPLVLQLLRSVDKKSKAGWRDYAILYLMAHYGLRHSEVAALKSDSVDFEAKLLRVEQRKTRSQLILPLSGSAIRVLRRYLQHGRPVNTHAALFVRARRPSGGIKHYAVCDIFQKRALQYGLPAGQYSSYSLRHAFAMRLLQRKRFTEHMLPAAC